MEMWKETGFCYRKLRRAASAYNKENEWIIGSEGGVLLRICRRFKIVSYRKRFKNRIVLLIMKLVLLPLLLYYAINTNALPIVARFVRDLNNSSYLVQFVSLLEKIALIAITINFYRWIFSHVRIGKIVSRTDADSNCDVNSLHCKTPFDFPIRKKI